MPARGNILSPSCWSQVGSMWGQFGGVLERRYSGEFGLLGLNFSSISLLFFLSLLLLSLLLSFFSRIARRLFSFSNPLTSSHLPVTPLNVFSRSFRQVLTDRQSLTCRSTCLSLSTVSNYLTDICESPHRRNRRPRNDNWWDCRIILTLHILQLIFAPFYSFPSVFPRLTCLLELQAFTHQRLTDRHARFTPSVDDTIRGT